MRLLDLFSGAGGAAMGYSRAGFDDIVGVDINPQPRYPFKFIQANALEYITEYGDMFDAIHASPPCQEYSVTKSLHKHIEYPDLLPATREALIQTRKPWVIENVVGAPFEHWIVLCGTMFGLRTYRHRRFESSMMLFQPLHPRHIEKTLHGGYDPEWAGFFTVTGGGNAPQATMQKAMGIDWMIRRELTQAIPPAYTELIGSQLLRAISFAPTTGK